MKLSMTKAYTVLVDTPSVTALLSKIEDDLKARRRFAVATLNLDHIGKLKISDTFRRAYARQTHIVADGNPVVWLSRIAGQPVQLAPGSELIHPVMAMAARLGVPVALLGSTDKALGRAADRLEAAHPGLRIVARIAPPFGLDAEGSGGAAALDAVRRSGARLCFLALGAPKQEILAARGLDLVPECGFLSVGAGIDFIAGTQRRAPAWIRAMAMEWLWRMMGDPRRLRGRYARAFAILPGLLLQAMGMRLASRPLPARRLEGFAIGAPLTKAHASGDR